MPNPNFAAGQVGVAHRFGPGNPGKKPGTLAKTTREIRAFARRLLTDAAYVEALKKRLLEGTAGPIEVLLYHYGWGQPHKVVEVEGRVQAIGELTVKVIPSRIDPVVIELGQDGQRLIESDGARRGTGPR
jgi:hypothetical protein